MGGGGSAGRGGRVRRGVEGGVDFEQPPRFYGAEAVDIGRTIGVQVSLLQLPIHDMGVGPPDQVLLLAKRIITLLAAGERVYIHCTGGHGRTGLVAAVVIGFLYGLDAAMAMRVVQWAHDCRRDVTYPLSPQTINQRNQVHRILEHRHVVQPTDVLPTFLSADVGEGPKRWAHASSGPLEHLV